MITAIALSGGVDSLVAAYLLKEQGHDVIGIHFTTGYESVSPDQIRTAVEQIRIPVHILDCRTLFDNAVVDYFIQTYRLGKTPNPCLACNPLIKFGAVSDFACKQGAEFLCTGHYARIRKDSDGRFHLFKGADPKKDQSYFLGFLSQHQLARACFPLGNLTKLQVLDIASEKNIIPVTTTESQDICFIRGQTYKEFLLEKGFAPMPGLIKDVHGKVLGEHQGLHLFTVGQRRGINCPASEPYYVVRLDTQNNRLVVGFKTDLLSSQCRVIQMNWINAPPDFPAQVQVRIRYRHRAVSATLFSEEPYNTVCVRFETPQAAVTPGQGAVFYQGDEVLGGGWIEQAE